MSTWEEEVWSELEDVVHDHDAEFKVGMATATCWYGGLRVTLTDPDGPSRGMTFYRAGAARPVDVAREVLDEFYAALNEGLQPLPRPAWMGPDE